MNLIKTLTASTVLVAVSVMGTACSSVQHKDAKDVSYALDHENHNPEKAGIYVFRSKYDPTHVYRDLYLDDKFVTRIGGCGYFFREVEPGEHTVTTYSRWGNHIQVTINAEAGKEYYLMQGYDPTKFTWLTFLPTPMTIDAASIYGGRKTIDYCPNDLLPDLDGTQPDLQSNASIEKKHISEEVLSRK